MKEITAAGGVLFKIEEEDLFVLLIYRRGVWDLPKGKLEEGESVEECAIREVEEEVGCNTPKSVGELVDTYHEYKEDGVEYGKTTYWYAMKTSTEKGFTPQTDEDIIDVSWFSLKEAIEMVGYKNLREVLLSFRDWYSKKS